MSCIALAIGIIAGRESNKWTWSATPPMLRAFILFSRAMPPRKGQSLSRSCVVINGRRSFVLNTQCEYELTYDIGAIQPSLRDLCNGEFKPGSKLPGYSQVSLREMVTTKCPNSRGRTQVRPLFFCKDNEWELLAGSPGAC